MNEDKGNDKTERSGEHEYHQLSFLSWVVSLKEQLRYKIVALVAFGLAGAAIGPLKPGNWLSMDLHAIGRYLETAQSQRASLMFLQAAMCFLLAVFTPKPSATRLTETTPHAKEIADRACRRIQIHVVSIFLIWSIYYIVFGISLHSVRGPIDRIFITTLSSITTILIFWLYLELAEITVTDKPGQATARNLLEVPHGVLFARLISVGVILLFVVPAWFAYLKAQTDVALPGVIGVAEIGIATLSGVSLALAVGSLGNKHLNPGALALGGLYLYAILQPAATAFGNPAVQLITTTVALPLKIVLWLVCVWAFTTGVLAEYAYEERKLIERQMQRRQRRPRVAAALPQ